VCPTTPPATAPCSNTSQSPSQHRQALCPTSLPPSGWPAPLSPEGRPAGPSAKRLTASRHPLSTPGVDTGRLLSPNCERTGRRRRGLLSAGRQRSIRLCFCPASQPVARLRYRVNARARTSRGFTAGSSQVAESMAQGAGRDPCSCICKSRRLSRGFGEGRLGKDRAVMLRIDRCLRGSLSPSQGGGGVRRDLVGARAVVPADGEGDRGCPCVVGEHDARAVGVEERNVV
jgi:hypothetical protein